MTFQEKEKWFNDNFTANPRDTICDCSACVFRNTKPYCLSMSCFCLDVHDIHTFYWTSQLRLGLVIPEDVYNFFKDTDKQDIKQISINSMKKALTKKTKTR